MKEIFEKECREAFESWCKGPLDKEMDAYSINKTNLLWLTWQESWFTIRSKMLKENHDLGNEICGLQEELQEQCLLNGMGSEREAKLLAAADKMYYALYKIRKMSIEEPEGWAQGACSNLLRGLMNEVAGVPALESYENVKNG